MRIKTTTVKPAQVFKSMSEIDYYLSKQQYHDNPIPVNLYIESHNFDMIPPRYTCITKIETSFLDFNLTLKLKNGLEITLIKYYKYLETPLYKAINS